MFNSESQIVDFFQNSHQDVPVHLEHVVSDSFWFVGAVLLLGVILIAFTRIIEGSYIKGIVINFFSLKSSESLQKNQIKLDSIPSLLLLTNYLVCLLVCFVLFLNAFVTVETTSLLLWSVTCVAGIVVYQLFGLAIAAWVTGEAEFIKENVIQTIAGFQFAGIIYLILAIFWYLYPGFRIELFYSFAVVIIVLLSIRLIRGIVSSLIFGVPWYYIILYFCTLEILPILVTYYYVAQNFKV